jgi:hypothetical protein
MKILVETRDQQATQNDRQADSARYLNELNSVCDTYRPILRCGFMVT